VAKRWAAWLAFAVLLFCLLLLLVFAHHNWIENVAAPPLWWRAAYGAAFAVFSAAMAFTVLATSFRLSRASLWLLDAMQPSAYGIFLFHYMFIIWMQYFVYDPAWPAGVKAAVVFAGTLGGSWLMTVLLRKIPLVARTI
jgi:surface polysaccharide O-acyltransferase-like enzyme